MPWPEKPCPDCGEVFPVNRLRYHRRDTHGVPLNTRKAAAVDDDFGPADAQPKPRGKHAAREGAAPAPMSVEAQFKFMYELLATVTRDQAPLASSAIRTQAGPCARADEQLLRRWPKAYEAIEKGLVAGDIFAVLMAHLPIIRAVREEIDVRRREQMIREGVFGADQEPAAA